jgi:hypothetical protein
MIQSLQRHALSAVSQHVSFYVEELEEKKRGGCSLCGVPLALRLTNSLGGTSG